MLEYIRVKEKKTKRVSKMRENSPNLWWKLEVRWNNIIMKLEPSPATVPFDSFLIGVPADSCPACALWLRE